MRMVRILGLAGVGFLFSAQAILAQNIAQGPHGNSFVPNGGGGPFGFGPHVVTGEPYSGVRTSAFVQTLANGTTINRTTTTNEARDSSGRLYRATQVTDGNGSVRTLYSVFDPVNHTTTNWGSDSKEAVVSSLPQGSGNRGQWRKGDGAPNNQPAAGPFHRHGPAPTVQQLGTKTIEGIDATGTRTDITFPAGAFGNNEPITVTHERWGSSVLGIIVLETDNDPRTGVHTTTLTNISRGEPDPTLFQPPQGYTITQRTHGQRF
jgi:hypothetical protein